MIKFNEPSQLLTREQSRAAINAPVFVDADYGWVASIDTGIGHNCLITVAKVSGKVGSKRLVRHEKTISIGELKGTALEMSDRIIDKLSMACLPNLNIVINSTGIGGAIAELLQEWSESKGYTLQYLDWSMPCSGDLDLPHTLRSPTLRVFAHVMARDAIIDLRQSIDDHPETGVQTSRLAFSLDSAGKYSLSIFKTLNARRTATTQVRFNNHCFMQIANYTPIGG